MAQLYLQKNAQPDTWVMSGAPTATTVFLSLAATINYSDGTSDTLPANTKAVLPDATTVFDRTHDVYVPYTVQGSGVLSIIKESLLPTLTSDYAPLARVELHGIKPYQPEPYLAAGALGAGGGAPSTLVLLSRAGQGKATDLGAGGTPPAGWYTAGFDDSAWAATVAQDGTMAPLTGYTGTADFVSWSGVFATAPDDVWLFRQALTLPPGVITAATLQVGADNYVLDLYLGGTRVYGPGTGLNLWYTGGGVGPQTTAVSTGALVAGGTTVLAARIQNEHNAGVAQPTAFAYNLEVTYAGAAGVLAIAGATEGDLAYYHDGAWQRLPLGTAGQELTVVSGDPAWATPPSAGTVTSVAFSGPTGTSTSGSPITSSGTIALSWAGQSANTFLGAPNGSSGAPTFRVLAAADIPNLPASQITSGQLATARGGTGLDGSAASNGQLLIGNGSGYALATLSAGSGVTVANSSGGITVAATGSGGTVTSITLSMPGIFSVSPATITSSGTFSVTLANESAGTVFAGPTSGSAAPTFRALAAADLPAAPGAGGNVHAHGHFL